MRDEAASSAGLLESIAVDHSYVAARFRRRRTVKRIRTLPGPSPWNGLSARTWRIASITIASVAVVFDPRFARGGAVVVAACT